ncbi:MAG: hypothetical protein CBB97_00765 [Candidatus Endolissoclinum sp. TMED37]|nr:MAG: hypothetical protein CBB97_00765 [Candidatus Endolissoclinum sp. TMED37]|tara:strand:- start:1264 stop:1635 length:372 start_codon:yes stop_codon:yes gene_type:complete
MASTQLKNSKGMFKLQQNLNNEHLNYNKYKHQSIPINSHFPNLGINQGNMKAGFHNNILSNNPCDIESSLFGISSTNLVQPSFNPTPSLNTLNDKSFFDLPNAFLPNPLIIENNQRPKGPYSS